MKVDLVLDQPSLTPRFIAKECCPGCGQMAATSVVMRQGWSPDVTVRIAREDLNAIFARRHHGRYGRKCRGVKWLGKREKRRAAK